MPYNERSGRITLIAALDANLAIGKGGKLPWEKKLRADMQHFEDTTTKHVVVMGRKTYLSIPEKYRPLRNRENWILSRTWTNAPPGIRVFRSENYILGFAGNRELFVAGGAEVYKTFMPYATRLIITHVETEVEGADTFFPELPTTNWSKRILCRHAADEKNDFPFSIVEYRRLDEF